MTTNSQIGKQPEALVAFRKAWQLERDPSYGERFAYSAQRQNSYREAIATYETLLQMAGDPVNESMVLNHLGNLYREVHRLKDAEEAYSKALSIRRQLAQVDPTGQQPLVAMTLNNLAVLYDQMGKVDSAEAAFREALAIRRKFAKIDPRGNLPSIGAILTNLGILYSGTQRLSESERCLLEALDLRREIVRDGDPSGTVEVARTLNNLGILYSQTGRLKEADTTYRETLTIFREVAKLNRDAYLPKIAGILHNLGKLCRDAGSIPEAESLLEEARSSYETLARDQPEAYATGLAITLDSLAWLYIFDKRPSEALEILADLILVCRNLTKIDADKYNQKLAHALSRFASGCADSGRITDAETSYKEAVSIFNKPHAVTEELADIMNNLANFYSSTHQTIKAEDTYLEARAIHRRLASDDSSAPSFGHALLIGNLANFYEENGRVDEALEACIEAEAMMESLWKMSPAALADLLAATLWMHARLLKANNEPMDRCRVLGERALGVARNSQIRERIQGFIDSL